jgi:hypothetical protein
MIDLDRASDIELDAIAQRDPGERLLAEVYDLLGRFISYPSEHAHVAHALWILHTHLMDRWDSTPRIAFLSPEPGSGKSRALEITEMLVPNPVLAVNVSPAYLFRKIGAQNEDEGTATVLFDEIDTLFGPKAKENEEIRGVINAGHRRGAVAGRCVVKGKQIETEELPAYAALALAGLGWLPDTIESRSVIIRMQRKKPGEDVEPFRHRLHAAKGRDIRDRIVTWAKSAPSQIDWPQMPDGIEGRDADVWESLLAVADLVGGEWPERARKTAVTLVTVSREREPSLGVRLLADIKTVFGDESELPTATLLDGLRTLDEAPWADLKGKPLDDRSLAYRLKQYNIKSCRKWFGNKQARGYERSAFTDVWARYLPQHPASSVTSVTPVISKAARLCAHCGKVGDLRLVSIGGDETALHPHCIEAAQ